MLQPTPQLAAPSWLQPQRVHLVPSSCRIKRPSCCNAVSRASVATEPVLAPATVAHVALPAPEPARFEHDSTVFAEEFRIRGNEAGPDQRANIITIANLLQVRLAMTRPELLILPPMLLSTA